MLKFARNTVMTLPLALAVTLPLSTQVHAQDFGDVADGAIVGGVVGGVVGGRKGAQAGAVVGAIGGIIEGAIRDDFIEDVIIEDMFFD